MKYLDRNGKAHGSWHKAIVADVKAAFEPKGKRELLDTSPDGDRYQVPESYYYEGHPVPPTTPEIVQSIPSKIVIDYETQVLKLLDQNGNVMNQNRINERLLYGLSRDIIEKNLTEIGGEVPEMIDSIAKRINHENDDAINRVVAAATGKNCILSPAFSEEFINCAAENIMTALVENPVQVESHGLDFIKSILSGMENVINERLAPKESDDGEPKG